MGSGAKTVDSPSRLLKNSLPPQFDSVPDSLGFRCVPGFDHAWWTSSTACQSVLRLGRIGAGFPNQRDFDSTCWLGGGQQEMAKPYSQDLRDRVIDAVETRRAPLAHRPWVRVMLVFAQSLPPRRRGSRQ